MLIDIDDLPGIEPKPPVPELIGEFRLLNQHGQVVGKKMALLNVVGGNAFLPLKSVTIDSVLDCVLGRVTCYVVSLDKSVNFPTPNLDGHNLRRGDSVTLQFPDFVFKVG